MLVPAPAARPEEQHVPSQGGRCWRVSGGPVWDRTTVRGSGAELPGPAGPIPRGCSSCAPGPPLRPVPAGAARVPLLAGFVCTWLFFMLLT